MTLKEALNYCYEHEKEFIFETCQEQFDCLIVLLKDGLIKPSEIKDYGMDY